MCRPPTLVQLFILKATYEIHLDVTERLNDTDEYFYNYNFGYISYRFDKPFQKIKNAL